jgi:hypothetical protein
MLVDVLILTPVSVVEPAPEGVSDVAVARAASAVDVPESSPETLIVGAAAVSVSLVMGTELVGWLIRVATGEAI